MKNIIYIALGAIGMGVASGAYYLYQQCQGKTQQNKNCGNEPKPKAVPILLKKGREITEKFISGAATVTNAVGCLSPSVLVSRAYTKTQNLGQDYNGVSKYLTKDEQGKPTGIGYSFEDLCVLEWQKQGREVIQVPEKKCGADFLVEGIGLVQCKCCAFPERTASAFYDDETLKYPGQVACVPSEQVEKVRISFQHRKNRFNDIPEEVVAPCTRADAEKYLKRGIDSFKMDLQNKRLWIVPIIEGVIICVTGIYYTIETAVDEQKNFYYYLKGIALSLGAGALVFAGGLFFSCADRQRYRMA